MLSATFLWAAVSLAVFFGRSLMLPIYLDLSLDLPSITSWLFEKTTLIILLAVTFSTPGVWYVLSSSRRRNIFSGVAIVCVIVFGIVCIYAFFLPLVGTISSLG